MRTRSAPAAGAARPPAGGAGGGRTLRVVVAAAAVGAVAAGVVLRFVATSDLWLDEALSVHIAERAVSDIPAALRQDGHPPLYYWLLHAWMRLVGDGDLAVRALSGVLAVATLPVLWVVARRRWDATVAGVAVLLLASSPFAIRYATEVRMYALAMLLVALAWLALDEAWRRPRLPGAPVLAAIATLSGALLLTHYWALYVLGAAGIGLGALALRPSLLACRPSTAGDGDGGLRGPDGPAGSPAGGERARDVRARALRTLGAVAAGGLAFVPWLPSFWYQAQHTGTPWTRPDRPANVVMISLTDLGGGPYGEAQLLGIGLAALAVLALTARPVGRWLVQLDLRTVPGVRPELAAVAGTLALAVLAGYATGSGFASRYIAVVVPLFLGAAAVGVARLPGPALRVGLVAALVATGLLGGVRNALTERTQGGEIGRTLAAEAGPADVVAFCPDQLGPAVARHLPPGLAVRPFPTGDDARRVDWVDYAQRMATADPEGFARSLLDQAGAGDVWVVWASGYRTLEDSCERIVVALQGERPSGTVVASRPTFEHATLTRFPAP